MKRLLSSLLVIACLNSTAQLTVTEARTQTIGQDKVGIGTTTPDASAKLDIVSTTKGLLIPRMTNTQMNAISSPANGLQVYNTDSSALFFYNGSAWTKIGSGGSAGLSGLPVFNVANYGAVADSTTDNSPAIQAAVDAAYAAGPSLSKTVYIGPGRYIMNSTIRVPAGVIIQGAGANRWTYGYGASNTLLCMPSGNDTLFDVRGQAVKFRDIALKCTAAEVFGGAGIYTTNGIGFSINECYVEGFYDNIYLANGYSFSVQNTSICGMWRHGLILEDTPIPDEGDGIIMGCWFNPRHHDCETAIRQSSGGGVKIVGNKFNNAKAVTGVPDEGGPYYFQYCYFGRFYTGVTSDILFGTNSLENYSKGAIFIDPNLNFDGHVTIAGNQFASYFNGTRDITINNTFPSNPKAGGFAITGNAFLASNTSQTVIGTETNPYNANYDSIVSGYSFIGNTINGDYIDRPMIIGGTIHGNDPYLPAVNFYAKDNTTSGYATVLALGTSPTAKNSGQVRFVQIGAGSNSNRMDFNFDGIGGGLLSLTAGQKIMMILPVYADNAAALTGGLISTMLYKTSTGEVRIVN